MSGGAATSSMSQWIKFFSEAGIPAGIAANYAVVFSEHRIQQDMLMELTKEYLSEMGITTLGDIIAILRHAKQVHTQNTRDKALKETSSARSSPVPRRSTAASRTVNHYIGKEPDAVPMNQTPPPTGPKISAELANRLGTTPVADTQDTAPKEVKTITLKKSKEEVPVPKIRRVLPEHEGKYKVIMPQGTTEKTKKIIGQKRAASEKSPSVFARLGQSTGEDEPSGAKVTITGLDKVVIKTPATSTTQSSVFDRLGGLSSQPVKRAASSTCPDSDDSDYGGIQLKYAGVLKQPSAETKKVSLVKKKAVVVQRKKLMMKKKKLVTQKPEVSTSTQGILADGASSEKKSALARLGKKTAPDSSPTGMIIEDFTISKGLECRLSSQKPTASVSSRLGPPRSSTVSSSLDVSPSSKLITKHLRVSQTQKSASTKSKSGVFSRLGKST